MENKPPVAPTPIELTVPTPIDIPTAPSEAVPPAATPVPTPPVGTDELVPNGVWISREEYDRLRDAPGAQAIGSGPMSGTQDAQAETNRKDFWTYACGAIAVLVFLGLTANFGQLFSVPLTIGLIVFIILAIVSLLKPKKVNQTITGSSVYAPPAKSGATKILGIVLLLIVLVPIAPFALLIFFFILLASTGQASGS